MSALHASTSYYCTRCASVCDSGCVVVNCGKHTYCDDCLHTILRTHSGQFLVDAPSQCLLCPGHAPKFGRFVQFKVSTELEFVRQLSSANALNSEPDDAYYVCKIANRYNQPCNRLVLVKNRKLHDKYQCVQYCCSGCSTYVNTHPSMPVDELALQCSKLELYLHFKTMQAFQQKCKDLGAAISSALDIAPHETSIYDPSSNLNLLLARLQNGVKLESHTIVLKDQLSKETVLLACEFERQVDYFTRRERLTPDIVQRMETALIELQAIQTDLPRLCVKMIETRKEWSLLPELYPDLKRKREPCSKQDMANAQHLLAHLNSLCSDL